MTPTDAPTPRPSDGSGSGSEADPTGMRALLSSLPDPGPMPEDLVRRIEARLAVEAHAAAGSTCRERSADRLVDLAAERSSRRPVRTVALLGVAAAGLLATTLGLGQVVDGGILGSRSATDSAAQYPTASTMARDDQAGADAADAGSAAGSDLEIDESGPGGTGDDGAGAADAATEEEAAALADSPAADTDLDLTTLPEELVVLAALGPVTTDDYRDRLDEQAGRAAAAPAADLTREEVVACWSATGSPHPWDSVHAAPADLAGVPVVVLVGRSGDRGEAFLMPWTCTDATGDAGVDVRAVPVDHSSWPDED